MNNFISWTYLVIIVFNVHLDFSSSCELVSKFYFFILITIPTVHIYFSWNSNLKSLKCFKWSICKNKHVSCSKNGLKRYNNVNYIQTFKCFIIYQVKSKFAYIYIPMLVLLVQYKLVLRVFLSGSPQNICFLYSWPTFLYSISVFITALNFVQIAVKQYCFVQFIN